MLIGCDNYAGKWERIPFRSKIKFGKKFFYTNVNISKLTLIKYVCECK